MSIESCTYFQELPEGCIANVLSLTSPKDACRLSLVNSTFHSAAESDAVWESFLPTDYRHIFSRSIDGADSLLAKFRTKKELYLHLCHKHILIDGGTKSFSLEKGTGKKCFMLASRDLFIVMGDVPEFWQWISYPYSRFPEAAELLSVRRFDSFEIRGKINSGMLSSGTNYAAYLVFTSRSRIEGFQFHHAGPWIRVIGLETKPRIVCVDQRQSCQTVPSLTFFMHQISHLFRRVDNTATESNRKYPKLRGDGWMEVELGEFFVMEKQDRDVKMILKVLKGGFWNWKIGLVIQGIEIRPRAA